MSSPSPHAALQHFPTALALAPEVQVQYRQAGHAARVTHVLLHGIGSGSGSWVRQLQAAEPRQDRRVLAWDAPGYGRSAPLELQHPQAADYARRLWLWLDALGQDQPITLVGHSLGALMAAAATLQHPERVARLVLLSPARGYGDAPEADREAKLATRLATLHKLGPAGMANARAAAMLSPDADDGMVDLVRETMAQIDPAGYTQASRMLSTGRLDADLARVSVPLSVASGSADTITPPDACADVAHRKDLPWTDLGPVGHVCALEAAARVNALLDL
ncbi:alpha/beta fold hydrolase [Hydrogenophaga sp. OTU3427]|uniref:alpha/beta fold hydrolase n=1 Tax=Hydrogenophaga sp. OTU3427 TaxID=3043856 RepID=UPI00313B46D8